MSIVLVSGGLDSAVALAWAIKRLGSGEPITPISFYYGQRHEKEMDQAAELCNHFGIPEPVFFDLSNVFGQIGGSSLLDQVSDENPSTETVDRTKSELPPTFVPGRNAMFLTVAASYGYVIKEYNIIGGWNAVDYSGYPDCREGFLVSQQTTLNRAMFNSPDEPGKFVIYTPLVHLTKAQIIQLGRDLDVPFHLTWSCYAGGDKPCGECDSCKIRAAGFKEVGVDDPALF